MEPLRVSDMRVEKLVNGTLIGRVNAGVGNVLSDDENVSTEQAFSSTKLTDDELLEAIASYSGEGIIFLTYAKSQKIQETVQHVLQGIKEMGEELNHVS